MQRRPRAGPDEADGRVFLRARAGSVRYDRGIPPDGLQSPPPAARKAGSVGPGTGVSITIRDERGAELPFLQPGEVCIDGPGVIREYENNPEATAKSFFENWFRTGDQGIIDQDGYLRLTGRLKELIIRAGENIAPREIDEVLLLHPSVAEAVCFGVPHPTWGEEVEAAVVLRPESEPAGEAALIAVLPHPSGRFQVPQEDPPAHFDSAHGHRQDPATECSRDPSGAAR